MLRAEKIDFHVHSASHDEAGLTALIKSNRSAGIIKAVLLALRTTHSTVDDVRRVNDWVLSAATRYPGEIVPFVTVLESDPGAGEMLREYVGRGARGLKLIGWTGACIKQHDYDLNSTTMRECFAVAESHGLPVVLHLCALLPTLDRTQHCRGRHCVMC